MSKTFMTFSLGCKVNSYENSAISAQLVQRGYIETKENPDIVIINTCSVTATADQKSRQHIRKFQKLYPNAMIVVMGCYAQGNKDYISKVIKPTILVGTSNRNKIVDYIEKGKKVVDVNEDFKSFNYEEFGITSFSENVRAYLKIEDGCNNFCTYCIVPYRRGRMRSRDPISVISEAQHLVKKGYNEIVISGVDIGSYGKDIGNITFSDLIEKLLDIPELRRLRISSIEASQIDEKLINLYKTRNNLAKHMHIPLQSGSFSVLKRMNRKYTPEEFLQKIKMVQDSVPGIALSTDVIVGFPGESENEFNETFSFIRECNFNMLHIFPYSMRSGTIAAKMDNQIDAKIKKERAKQLLDYSKRSWKLYCESFIGKDLEVLVEKYDVTSKCNIGHTSNYIEVAIPSLEGKVGEFITTKINKTSIIS